MRTGTVFKKYELFVASSVLASHANAKGKGFRQKDVKFLIELFSNWVETTFEGSVLTISNTQVLRYLDSLIEEGFARKIQGSQHPAYKLSRVGLLELLARIIPSSLHVTPEHFFFIHYFLKSYKSRLLEVVKLEGSRFPSSLRLEVDLLLDTEKLLEQQIAFVRLEISRLQERVSDAESSNTLAHRLFAEGKSIDEVARQVEAKHPYELNSQKPLRELFSEVPEGLAEWELKQGSLNRAELIWCPSLRLMQAYLESLESVRSRD